MEEKLVFRKLDGTHIGDVEKYVKDWVKENPYGEVIIGCDSQIHSRRIKYAILIVMHRVDRTGTGHGCHVLLADVWIKRMMKSQIDEMPSKLWKEAEFALQAAEMVNGKDEFFKKRITVHLHFNSVEKEKSNMMYAAGIGLLQSAGYVALGKPAAKMSSNGADHFCR